MSQLMNRLESGVQQIAEGVKEAASILISQATDLMLCAHDNSQKSQQTEKPTTKELSTGDTLQSSPTREVLTMPNGEKLIFTPKSPDKEGRTWQMYDGGKLNHKPGIVVLSNPPEYNWSLADLKGKLKAHCLEVDGITTMTFPNSKDSITFDKDGVLSITRKGKTVELRTPPEKPAPPPLKL